MRNTFLISLILVMTLKALVTASAPTPIDKMSLSQLEDRAEQISGELAQLPNPSMRSGTGTIGFRSKWHPDANHREWIKIDLGGEFMIDEIILVPLIRRDAEGNFLADGVPHNFVIRVGTDEDLVGKVVARYHKPDGTFSGSAPLVISLNPTVASWVKLEAVTLSQRNFDGHYVLQLSEMLVFHQDVNVALRRCVETSSESRGVESAWGSLYLTDGQMPYLMDAAGGNPSVAYLSFSAEEHVFTMDLGKAYPLSEVHLHSLEQGDMVPQSAADGIGVPGQLQILGANRADFQDAVTLLELGPTDLRGSGPIKMWPFPETTCRYVRFVADAPLIRETNETLFKVGFAEIALFSAGQNIALGTNVELDSFNEKPRRSGKSLTDGNNLYGAILPIRNWLEGLARRHALELEKSLVTEELAVRYGRQKRNLKRVGWLAAVLGIGIVATILINWVTRRRYVAKLKERLAADLHDELGADVHAIGLLSDAADTAHASPEEWKTLHRRIREMTERTGIAIRHCANMIEAKGLVIGLAEDMRRAARRSMGRFHHEITMEGEGYLDQLPAQTRLDLLLFYKECLVNISRHSGATGFGTELIASPESLQLTVSDNGTGIAETEGVKVPPSLQRRAKLLGARVEIVQVQGEGTRIKLTLKPRRRLFFRRKNQSLLSL
ncbi:hypothetical protein ACFPK9_12200 [Rubritalea spongiae]